MEFLIDLSAAADAKSVFGYPTDREELHARFGGKNYYQACSGLSGAGFIHAPVTLRRVGAYATHNWLISVGYNPADEHVPGGMKVFIPHDHVKGIDPSHPAIVLDREGKISLVAQCLLLGYLRGERQQPAAKTLRVTYFPGVKSEEKVLEVPYTTYGWVDPKQVRRILEGLHSGEIHFSLPKEEEGPAGSFWRHMGAFVHRPSGKVFKLRRRVARERYDLTEVLGSVEGLQKMLSAKSLALVAEGDHALYVQEGKCGEWNEFAATAHFLQVIEGREWECEVLISPERLIAVYAGDTAGLLAECQEQLASLKEQKLAQEAYWAEQEARYQAWVKAHGDLLLSIEEAMEVMPNYEHYWVQEVFSGRSEMTYAEIGSAAGDRLARKLLHALRRLEKSASGE